MSNYALVLSDGGSGNSAASATGATPADVKTATALGITGRLRGDQLRNATGDFAGNVLVVLAFGKLGISCISSAGEIYMDIWGPGYPTHYPTTAHITATSVDAALYYGIKGWWDTAATDKQYVALYSPTSTLLMDGTDAVGTALADNGYGTIAINGTGGLSSQAGAWDWLAIWDSAANVPAGAPVKPTAGATGLLHLYEFNEGTGATAADSQGTADLTAIGTHSWELLSAAPDHITVTLDSYSLATYPTAGTATASAIGYDVSNVALVPQPTFVYSVTNGAAVTVNSSTGVVTAAGAGAAQIRATASGVHGDSTDVTVIPSILFTGAIAVTG